MVGKKSVKNKQKMTIDRLAVMVQRGFVDVHETMDKGFKGVHEKMDKGFEVVNGHLNTIDRRLDSLAQDHSDRLNLLEKKVGIT